MLKIGIVTGNATAESLNLVTDAERLGVDSAWIPEAWMFDGLTPAAYLAGRTETMRLGTACVQLGSRSPALPAEAPNIFYGSPFECFQAFFIAVDTVNSLGSLVKFFGNFVGNFGQGLGRGQPYR